MKILVTGASGFVGSHLVPYLLEAGHHIIASGRNKDRLEKTFSEKNKKLTLFTTSYNNEELGSLFSSHKIDALIHLAAKRYSNDTPESLEGYLDANLILTERLFRTAAQNGVKNIIFLSSIAVYSAENTLPFLENEPARPDNFYGFSKLMGEELASMYNRIHGMQIKSLRVAQLVGKGEREGYMLAEFMEKARKGESLVVWGEGKGARDYLYIEDLNSAILAVLSYEKAGIFNIGSGRPVTHLELAEEINRVFDNEAGIEMKNNKKEDTNARFMKVSSAKELLRWTPSSDLKSAIKAIVL